MGISFNPSYSVKRLQKLENTLAHALPNDLKFLYIFCDGFEIFDFLFRMLTIEEIIRDKHRNDSFILAEYMLYSDAWILEVVGPNDYYITNSNHETEDTIRLTNFIFEFLNRYVNGGAVMGENGLCNWYGELK